MRGAHRRGSKGDKFRTAQLIAQLARLRYGADQLLYTLFMDVALFVQLFYQPERGLPIAHRSGPPARRGIDRNEVDGIASDV